MFNGRGLCESVKLFLSRVSDWSQKGCGFPLCLTRPISYCYRASAWFRARLLTLNHLLIIRRSFRIRRKDTLSPVAGACSSSMISCMSNHRDSAGPWHNVLQLRLIFRSATILTRQGTPIAAIIRHECPARVSGVLVQIGDRIAITRDIQYAIRIDG
jgi:hypothetical protein